MVNSTLAENEKKMDMATVLMMAASTVLTLVFPVLASVFNFFGMILMNGKARKYYAFLFAFSLAVIAYVWIPDSSMDLYRHHYDVGLLTGFNVEKLGVFIKANLEPLHYLIKFVVGQTGNYNLLQFIVVLIGYFGLFWMICDLAEIKKCKRAVFSLICLYAFSVIRFIDFASGLWFNLSIITIALGVYLSYYRETKWMQYVMYAMAACIHVGTIYAIVLIIIMSKLRLFKRIRLSVVLMTFLVMLSFGGIVLLINNVFGSEFQLVGILNRMYDGYFVNGLQFEELHTGWSLSLSVANMVLCLILGIWHYKKIKVMRDYDCLLIYFTVSVMATIVGAGVFIRFRSLSVMLALPLIISYLRDVKSKGAGLILVLAIVVLTSIQLYRSFVQAQSTGLMQRMNVNITRSVFNLSGGGG